MIMDMKRTKIMAIGIALSFLLIHILIINVFYQCGVTPMVRFNYFSIAFYVVMIICALKGWLQVYCVGVFLEVVIHMTLAILYTGWDSDFQITLIGMNVLAFYGEYVGRSLKIRYVRMLPFAIFGSLLYLGSYVYIEYFPPKYSLPEKAYFGLSLMWGVIVFLITIFVLQMFVTIAITFEKMLEHQKSHDKLTGLPNRYYVSEYLAEVEKKHGLEFYWLAIADIDDFKLINDTYGHNCGDYVLQTVANIFTARPDVMCCRWGGEEFIFINPIYDSIENAYNLLEELRKEIEEREFKFEGFKFHITVTIGMAEYHSHADSDSWISDADAKLYYGKENGKNQIVR